MDSRELRGASARRAPREDGGPLVAPLLKRQKISSSALGSRLTEVPFSGSVLGGVPRVSVAGDATSFVAEDEPCSMRRHIKCRRAMGGADVGSRVSRDVDRESFSSICGNAKSESESGRWAMARHLLGGEVMKRLTLLASLLLAACTASTEESESSSGQAVGERWLSPISVGSYDNADETITVGNTALSQQVFYMTHDAPFFGKTHAYEGGILDVIDDLGDVRFTLHRASNNVDILCIPPDHHNGRGLVRRRDNALKGTFGDPASTDYVVVVTASSDDALSLEVTPKAGGTTVKATAARGKQAGTFQSDAFAGCSFNVARESGEYVLWATDTEYRPASAGGGCALLGKYYAKQHYASASADSAQASDE